MFSFITLPIAAIAAFILGCLVGLLLTRTLSSREQKTRLLETRLQQAEESLSHYRQEVTEHFSETAKLVNNLTQSYKDVHQHLAGSALKLTDIDINHQLLSTYDMNDSNKAINEEDCQVPKDWAPAKGILRENYGLNEKDEPFETKDETFETITRSTHQ
ncbi:hypothetical protein AB835_06470 [Candidatus Endobugula sertula]|uniref:Z-ring associated protein G n=1 Tax=Candidatus Endobugula sertula TaxID=62101 RepID=A0A1D2QQQ3_9GAMM|nr:hypothetical protein AB835_06470 [Candidatus Endobugula sertula]